MGLITAVTDYKAFEDVIAPLWAAYNAKEYHADQSEQWAFVVNDGEVVSGGIGGYMQREWMYVQHLIVAETSRGKGLGRTLLSAIIDAARQADLHILVGGIDAANGASIALHEQLGFVHAGTIRHAAFKFDRWLDLAFYQLMLSTPAHPVDG